mgnify:CR=1 FL=1
MKREWPFLALEVVLLAVLLQSNAPEVWFWFIALLVLLTWRSLALRSRLSLVQVLSHCWIQSAWSSSRASAGSGVHFGRSPALVMQQCAF